MKIFKRYPTSIATWFEEKEKTHTMTKLVSSKVDARPKLVTTSIMYFIHDLLPNYNLT
jgi:hypothetical protein